MHEKDDRAKSTISEMEACLGLGKVDGGGVEDEGQA